MDEKKIEQASWYVQPLGPKKVYHGCLTCGGTSKKLSLKTRLYMGFGGWTITRDGELYYSDLEMNREWNDCKELKEIEAEVKKDPDHDWRANFDLPLRGGQYQRHGNDLWELIESNQGFA